MEVDPATLTAALEHAPSGIVVLSEDGCIEWVNERMARLLRKERESFVGTPLAELIHPEDQIPNELDVRRHSIGRTVDCGRKRFVRPGGDWVSTSLIVNRFSVPGPPPGASSYLVANVFDLTELVHAERRIDSIVEGLDEAVVSVDANGRIAVANPAAHRLLDPLGAPLIGLDLARVPWDVIDETGVLLDVRERPELLALDVGRPVFATIGLRRDDDTRWVDVAAHPIVRSGEHSVAVTYKDVSERLRIEAALRQAEAADRAKSEFLSRMSHELRTPLNSVLGFAQLLQIDDLAAAQREAVDHILGAGRHLLGLLDEVLDLERMQSGRFEVRVQPVAVARVLQEAVELVQPLAVARGIAIDLKLGREGPSHVLADEQRLRQVLLNLLTNGVKFNRTHGRVTVSCHVVFDAMVIRVRDTGLGIATADISQIFMPFERLDADRRGIEGAGVGLALAKRLTEAMGGAIGVESERGNGSTFFLVLRTTGPGTVVVEAPPPVSVERLAELVRRTDPGRRRVLYVEDNEDSRALMERIAEMHGGLDLTTAPTAGAGLERARASNPEAILLDLHLPDGSGEDLMAALQDDPGTRGTPVIVLSADATPQRRARLAEAGALAYLTKPVDLSELFAALERALGSRP